MPTMVISKISLENAIAVQQKKRKISSSLPNKDEIVSPNDQYKTIYKEHTKLLHRNKDLKCVPQKFAQLNLHETLKKMFAYCRSVSEKKTKVIFQ